MTSSRKSSSTGALILIACALAGAGISYHFTVQAQFAGLEKEISQNSLALQEHQTSQEEFLTSTRSTLADLNTKIETLQASLAPLGRDNHDQSASLADIRQQISVLQTALHDAQKKEVDHPLPPQKIPSAVQLIKPAVIPPAPVSAPPAVAAPVLPAPPVAHAIITGLPLPLPPHPNAELDLRPAPAMAGDDAPVRILSTALSVSDVP